MALVRHLETARSVPQRDHDLGTERETLIGLQKRFTKFIEKRFTNPDVRSRAVGVLRTSQEATLHMQNHKTGDKSVIDVSLVPIILSDETTKGLETFTQTSNLVRSAILMKMDEDPHLRRFIEAGVDPLAQEIMAANPFKPAKNQWRFRADTATNQLTQVMQGIENNGGEPQGDGVISDSVRVMEDVLGVCLDIPDDMQIRIAEYPDEQMMEVVINRFQEVTGTDQLPTIGYFAWRGRSSLSESEAIHTAVRYRERFEKDSIQFDPSDIVDIVKVESTAGKPYYKLVCETPSEDGSEPLRVEIDMIRRLHGEPMENSDLWQSFKDTHGQKMTSDGEETIWNRFITKLGDQMINPLNSYATDKKLDVILGNPKYLDHFGIWDKVDEIVADDALAEALSLTEETKALVRSGALPKYIRESFPSAFMLRKKSEGLYDGDKKGQELGLDDQQIATIKSNRELFVLKRGSLVGYAGNAVFVGGDLQMHEMDSEDFVSLGDEELEVLTGMNTREFVAKWEYGDVQTGEDVNTTQATIRNIIARRVETMADADKKVLQDRAWEVLIDNSLGKPDSLIQQAVEQYDAPAMFIRDANDPAESITMHYDLNPQSIGPTIYTYPVIRLSSATKTNITGGYGGLGVALSESMARSILDYADEHLVA